MGRIQFEKDKVEALEFASPGDGSGTLGMEGHSVKPHWWFSLPHSIQAPLTGLKRNEVIFKYGVGMGVGMMLGMELQASNSSLAQCWRFHSPVRIVPGKDTC